MASSDFIRNDNSLRDSEFEGKIRPSQFDQFKGQEHIIENLQIFVKAAKLRGEALDHVLLHGPPGLGKTTLANIISNELDVSIKTTSGPILEKPGDLAGLLTNLEKFDILFIDEIHRLSPIVEEYLYSAMEDYKIDIIIDKGPSARSIQIELNPFTLIGATTRSGLLTSPLRARFGINFHLEYYNSLVIENIIKRSSKILGIDKTTGTIEVGKDANLFISTGDALDMRGNNLTDAFVKGNRIDLNNEQKELYEKYKKKYDLK